MRIDIHKLLSKVTNTTSKVAHSIALAAVKCCLLDMSAITCISWILFVYES